MSRNLTIKQKRFVDAYTGPARGNGTQAARLAGYAGTENTLAVVARENLRKPQIQDAIGVALSTEGEAAEDVRREIIAMLLAEARGQTHDTAVVDGAVVAIPARSSTRLGALAQLAKIYRLNDERLQIIVQDSLDGFLDALEERLDPDVYDKIVDVLEELDGDPVTH